MATKVGMTQIFTEDGVMVPVTVVQVQDNLVTKKKTKDKDGYNAVQLGYGAIRPKLLNKPELGFFTKLNIEPKRFIKEFRLDEQTLNDYNVGEKAPTEWLADPNISLDVFAVSKGKGFAGVMKRHNFGGHRATHGTHESFRGPGSIGQREQPGKVMKGRKMAGQMGNERVCVKNLRIVKWLADDNVLCLRGAVPGAKGALLEIRLSNRKPKPIYGVAGAKEEKGLKNPMKASKAGAGKGKK